MGQNNTLPKIKRIELPAKAVRPLPGAKAVGQLPDGTPIWFGEIPATNPFFGAADATDNGHVRTPVMDPMDPSKQRWRKNRNGDPISPVFRQERVMRLTRYIMVDDGSAGCGPRPVPDNARDVTENERLEAMLPDFQKQVMMAAMQAGMTPKAVASALAKLVGESELEEESERAFDPTDGAQGGDNGAGIDLEATAVAAAAQARAEAGVSEGVLTPEQERALKKGKPSRRGG